MKKIFIIMVFAITVPAMASCPISGDGSCSFSIINPSTLQERHLPNNIETIKHSNRLEQNSQRMNSTEMLNVETGAASNIQDEKGYNSNCQFGVCLPGGMSAEEE